MGSLSRRVEHLLAELGELARDISEVSVAEGMVGGSAQWKKLVQIRGNLMEQGLPVPEELRQRISEFDSAASAAERLREGLTKVMQTLPGHKATSRRRGIRMRIGGVPIRVKFWTEVITKTAAWLLDNNYDLPDRLGRTVIIADDPSEFISAKELPNGRHLNVHGSAVELRRRSDAMLSHAGLPSETLEVEYEE